MVGSDSGTGVEVTAQLVSGQALGAALLPHCHRNHVSLLA